MGTVGFTGVQVVLAHIHGLAAVGAGHLIEGLAGDVIVVGVIRILFVVLVVFVLVAFVLVVVLVQVGFQILQLIAQVVDLVVCAGKILVHALQGLGHLRQQCAHGLDDFAFLGGLIHAQAVHKALQIGCLIAQFHTIALLVV